MTAMIATARPSVRLAASVAVRYWCSSRWRAAAASLLRVQVAVVQCLDLGRDLHDGIAPRHDLAAQKAVAIDLSVRAVEQRRVRAPVFIELAPELVGTVRDRSRATAVRAPESCCSLSSW